MQNREIFTLHSTYLLFLIPINIFLLFLLVFLLSQDGVVVVDVVSWYKQEVMLSMEWNYADYIG